MLVSLENTYFLKAKQAVYGGLWLLISGSHLSGSRLSGSCLSRSRANCSNCTPKELRRFGFRSWVVLWGTTPHDLAKDGDDKKVMGFAGASPMAIQCSIWSLCQNVQLFIIFLPVVLTQVYSGTASVNPRGLPSNSIGMHLKVLHIVRVAHRTDLWLAESS